MGARVGDCDAKRASKIKRACSHARDLSGTLRSFGFRGEDGPFLVPLALASALSPLTSTKGALETLLLGTQARSLYFANRNHVLTRSQIRVSTHTFGIA